MSRLLGWVIALSATGLLSHAWAGTISVPTNVPEPASMALLATGIAGVALAKFRRRK